MPVVVFYKDKKISDDVARRIINVLAEVSKDSLKAAIEVRVVEPVISYNANEIHLEMSFRDLGEWSVDQLKAYHHEVMADIKQLLLAAGVKCAFSFYITPQPSPPAIWEQIKL